jgi:hypothetical protein
MRPGLALVDFALETGVLQFPETARLGQGHSLASANGLDTLARLDLSHIAKSFQQRGEPDHNLISGEWNMPA